VRGYVTRIKGSPRGIEKKGEFAGVDLTISWFFGKYDTLKKEIWMNGNRYSAIPRLQSRIQTQRKSTGM